jgi:hypothetical protein
MIVMIRRLQQDNHSVGIVIDSDEEDIMFCPSCQKQGTLSKLKELIYLDDNGKLLPNPPPDADSWRTCWTCGLVVPTRDAKKSGKISGITGIDIIQNPYDEKKGVILGTDSRLTSRIKNIKRKQTRHPDKEIALLEAQGWELTSFSETVPSPTNPNE